MSATRPQLRLVNRYDAWNSAAWRGLYGDAEHAVEVLVQLGGERLGTQGQRAAVEEAAYAMDERTAGVLPLLAIVEHDRRVAWVYEDFDGVALLSVAGDASETVVPARVAAELVSKLVGILTSLPGPTRHPGPEDWDVLVDESGSVRLTGLVGPYPRSPRLFAPYGDTGDAALVFRLGVYLGTLLAGAPPDQATDETGHASTVRRLLVRAMARPNVLMPESLGSLLKSMLAWDPDDRPRLQALPQLLRDCIDASQPELADWCAQHIGSVRRGAVKRAQLLRGEYSAEAFGEGDDLTAVEEPTAVVLTDPSASPSHLSDETQQTHRRALDKNGRAGGSLNPSKFPVVVGPPPEIATKRPTLPPGFLGEAALREATVTGNGKGAATESGGLSVGSLLLGGVFAVVLVLGLLSLAVLLASQPVGSSQQEPSISDALSQPPADADRFDVTVLVRGGEPFTIRCGDEVEVSGVDEVKLPDVAPGPCYLDGIHEGQAVLVPFRVSRAATVRCFQTPRPICR